MERFLLIFWAFWLLLLLVAAFRVFAFPFARRRQDRRWSQRTHPQKSAAVIVPVKGFDLQSTPRFFDTLFAQDYASYRVIVAFESWNDPVATWLRDELEISESNPVWNHPEGGSRLKSITLVSAGTSDGEGQKVHNQRAAFEKLASEDEIIAFVDADIVFKPSWLSDLLAPINEKTHPLSTTYRWLIPKRPTLPNQVASVINGSITTQGGWESTTVLWGGSMAIARTVFDKLDVPNLFVGSLNDDLRLSKVARAEGNRIAFVRSLIVPTMVDFSWRSFFEFAKRQYTQVKIFSPILYKGTNLVLGFYALGALSIVAALVYGYFFAWIPVAAAYVIDQFRSLARQQIYLSLFPEQGIQRKLFSASWLEHMLTPFWMLLHWFLLVSTWTQTKITWAGITYRILGKDKTRILNRPVTAEKLPVGVPGLALIAALHDRKRGSYTQPIRPAATQPIAPLESPAVVTEKDPVTVPEVAAEASSEPIIPTIEEPATVVATPEPAPDTAPSPVVAHPGRSDWIPLLTASRRFVPGKASRKKKSRVSRFYTDSEFTSRARSKEKKQRDLPEPFQHFATSPNLAASLPPEGLSPSLPEADDKQSLTKTDFPIDASIENESAASQIIETILPSSTPTGGRAATRETLPRSRRIGIVGLRTSRSSRVNTTGTPFSPGRTARPISRGAAGRPS